MKQVVKSAIANLGYDVHRIQYAPQKRAEGMIAAWRHEGKSISFYLENRFDLIGRDLWNSRFYEQEELTLIRELADPEGVFVDVGANIGNHTVYFGGIIEARKVIAFEPGTWAHPRLCFNVALNGLSDRVEVHKAALSDSEGEAWMEFLSEDNHGTLAVGEKGKGERVSLHIGDSFLADEKVSVIKIDAERHEMHVLRGLTETLCQSKPLVMVEVLQQERTEVEAFFATHGYAVFNAVQRYGDIVNLLARPAT